MAKKRKNTNDSGRKRGKGASQQAGADAGRFGIHRPLLERIFFILALAGVLVTAHLNFWYSADQALADDPVCGVGFNCEAVLQSDPAPLGISSSVWGLLFYIVVAGACAGIAFLGDERRVLLKKARAAMVGFGFLYSMFLTGYQFFVLPERCLLCLLSATLVTLMTILLAVYLFRSSPASGRGKKAAAAQPDFKLYGALVVALLLLVGVDYGYYASQEPAVGSDDVLASVPAAADVPVDVSLCRFDAERPYYSNINMLVGEEDPILGNPNAPVTLMEFLDPNCPHCATLHPVMKAIAAKYPEQVRVVYKPVAIVGSASHSVEEVGALMLAHDAGKFQEMLDYQFVNQNPREGLSIEELSDYAATLGLDGDAFRQALEEGQMIPRIQRNRRVWQDLGFSGVPTVIFEGHVVFHRSRSVGCLSHFIEQELEAKGVMVESDSVHVNAENEDPTSDEEAEQEG